MPRNADNSDTCTRGRARPRPRPLRSRRGAPGATIRNRIMGLRFVKASELIPHPANWRRHPTAQSSVLRELLAEIGYADALITRETPRGLVLVDGHLRAELTPDTEVPVLVVDLSEQEARTVLATLDPIGALAERDGSILRDLLASITTHSVEVQAFLDRLMPPRLTKPEDPGARFLEAKVLQRKYRTTPGQVWRAGRHRLMCGDARAPAQVARLMGRDRAALFATDPPYLVGYTGADRPSKTRGRTGKDWSELYQDIPEGDVAGFYRTVFRNALAACRETAAWYVWHAHKWAAVIDEVWRELGILNHQQIVWVKPLPLPTFSYWPWRHEPCLMGFKAGAAPVRAADYRGYLERHTRACKAAIADLGKAMPADLPYWRERHAEVLMGWQEGHKPAHDGDNALYTSVWECDWEGGTRATHAQHPTQKPVELWARPMRKHTYRGEITLDLFLGSGTAAVAAEREERRCYAMELSPVFLAVALDRLERMGLEVKAVDG